MMNLQDWIFSLENFIARWAGTTTPRIVFAFVGLLACVLIVVAVWDKRIRIFWAILGLLCGGFLVAAAVDPALLGMLAATSFMTRIRIMMIILSILVIGVTVEAIRRSHLQERYAILWVTTGLIIVLTAFFPAILDFITAVLGTQYVTSVVGIVFCFLLLIAFHFSIALSGIQKKVAQVAQRCAMLETRLTELAKEVQELRVVMGPSGETTDRVRDEGASICAVDIPQPFESEGAPARKPLRKFPGAGIAAFGIVVCSFAAVLITGLVNPQAMVGDEVTHYYMLVEQAEDLSQPNFFARIPTNFGYTVERRYPHTFLWHYMGALVYRVSGGSFAAVQVYQALFWLQFLWVAYLLARSRSRETSRAPVLYLLVLASLPVGLLFSVAFYQDVPMAAQVLTAFYLLNQRRWLFASLFMSLAVGFKISALLFLPVFFGLLCYWQYRLGSWRKTLPAVLISVAILSSSVVGLGWALHEYGKAGFYPVEEMKKIGWAVQRVFTTDRQTTPAPSLEIGKDAAMPKFAARKEISPKPKPVTPYEAEIIANHPGDLRIPSNFVIYGGIVLWFVLLLGAAGARWWRNRRGIDPPVEPSWWLFVVGLWYLAVTAFFLRTAPDARFFLPGIPFVMLPLAERAVRLPRSKIIITFIAALAILQGAEVIKKAHSLRNVSSDLQTAIAFLEKTEIKPSRIFMYPEGNYRLFPYEHDWYLEYRLREFWRSDNDKRIDMLRRFGIGAVVVKKHLIADVDREITNLGVYPTDFVHDLEKDRRFRKIFENGAVIIYAVPRH